jgi:hypothetical protein
MKIKYAHSLIFTVLALSFSLNASAQVCYDEYRGVDYYCGAYVPVPTGVYYSTGVYTGTNYYNNYNHNGYHNGYYHGNNGNWHGGNNRHSYNGNRGTHGGHGNSGHR